MSISQKLSKFLFFYGIIVSPPPFLRILTPDLLEAFGQGFLEFPTCIGMHAMRIQYQVLRKLDTATPYFQCSTWTIEKLTKIIPLLVSHEPFIRKFFNIAGLANVQN